MGAPVVRWLTIVLEDPDERSGVAWRLWSAVTGAALSPPRGDPHVRVQVTGGAVSGAHLDLHVDDVEVAARHAVAVGATVVARPGHVVLASPSGFPLCLVAHRGERDAAPPTTWPGGHRSRLDQLTVDVAHDDWERELRFWADLTGWEVTPSAARWEFARLATPSGLPVRALLHRRRTGVTRGHVDLATDDREAEVARLEALGLTRLAHGPSWTVLQAPHGPVLCVTDRDPETGLLR